MPRRFRIDRLTSRVGLLEIGGEPAFGRCYLADGLISRLIGLLATSDLEATEALLIPHCRAMHTIGMRTTIDVAFIDDRDRVVEVVSRLTPCRAARNRAAGSVLEANSGALAQLAVGQPIAWRPAGPATARREPPSRPCPPTPGVGDAAQSGRNSRARGSR